jgi:GR25 family glycosyltransferase involved in LPS biosynthesis
MKDHIDCVYWINLNRSTDRRKIFEEETLPAFSNYNVQRFEAVDMTSEHTSRRRTAGCSLSHLSCWRHAMMRKYNNIIVLEDDLKLVLNQQKIQQLIQNLFKSHPEFNVCNLAYNHLGDKNPERSLNTGFYNFENIQTTSAYVANVKFLNQIYSHMMESAMNLFLGGDTELYAIDTSWKIFQKDDKWLCSKKIGHQRASYSEIEKKHTDYGV